MDVDQQGVNLELPPPPQLDPTEEEEEEVSEVKLCLKIKCCRREGEKNRVSLFPFFSAF